MSLVFSLGFAFQRTATAPATIPPPPVNVALPTISGTAQVGGVLTAADGTWTNSPTGFAYVWRRGGVAISGATASTYALVSADIGAAITVRVTASNAGGVSAPVTSAATAVVVVAPVGVAPSLVTPASVAVTATEYASQTYVFTPAVFSGTGVTVTRVLTLDGANVTSAMSGNTYVATKSETALRNLVMTYTAANGTAPNAVSTVTTIVPKAMHVVVWLGQSNIDYALNNGSPYTNSTILANIPITTVNARYIGFGNADIPITQANVTARNINPALVQASQWLNFVAPGKKFAFVDAAESGTTRQDLYNDSLIARDWSNTENVVNYAQNTHAPADLLIEWWYTGAENDISNMINTFMPFYTRQLPNGTPHTLGSSGVDHYLWDSNAPLFEKGEGLFARGHTKYTYIRNHHKDGSLASSEGIAAFWSDPRIQVFAAPQGVWGGHYANDGSHALTDDPDGQIQLQWPMAISIARLAGVTINEPEYVGHEVATDGTWADILVSLPNGGTLTTTRIIQGRAAPASPRTFMQPVMTMEVERLGSGLGRSPVHALGSASFNRIVAGTPAENADRETVTPGRRGTVTIQDTGSGSPRVGRIRITPEVPFVNGDRIVPQHPIWAEPYPQTFDSGAGLTQKYWLDFPIEHVPALVDPAAFYKLPGIPVKPFGPIQTISGVLGAPFIFTPRSVVTNSGSRAQNPLASTVVAGSNGGMFSMWFRSTGAGWPSTSRTLFQVRDSGSNIVMQLTTASSGRVSIAFNGIYTTAPVSGDFAHGVWNHMVVSWRNGFASQFSRNGGSPRTGTTVNTATLAIRTQGVESIGIGAQTSGSINWQGEIGHVYLNLNEGLDLSIASERAKFFNGSVPAGPANFGQFGQQLTGTTPAFYFDGDGASWSNLGSGPAVALAGTLTAGSTPVRP